jgi:homocysteine S-methyltransferase
VRSREELEARFGSRPALVLDGAMATELERLGADISGPLWSAHVLEEQPQRIAEVHRGYALAGADVLLTASYQVSRAGYRATGQSAAQADLALLRALALARSVAAEFPERDPLVALSLGPWGAVLHNGAEYHGEYDLEPGALGRFHAERIEVAVGAGADLLAFETIPSLEEAGQIAAALREFPQASAWISFCCRDGGRTAHGEPIEECVRRLEEEPQLIALGINCTHPGHVGSLLRRMAGAGSGGAAKPLLAYPNSGERWDAGARCWTGSRDADAFARLAAGWLDAGAAAVGGCCRTGREEIAALRRLVDARRVEAGGQDAFPLRQAPAGGRPPCDNTGKGHV